MVGVFKKTALVAALGASALAASSPAVAQRYDRGHGRGGNDAALAIGAGVLGLAVGAAIASDNRGRYYNGYNGYYDGGYYNRRVYAGPGYYGPGYDAYAPRYYYRDRGFRDHGFNGGYGFRGGHGGYGGGYGGHGGGGWGGRH